MNIRLVKRYNSDMNLWEIGYYRETRFYVLDRVRDYSDAVRLYEEEA